MTYIDIVNSVLRRLREATVTTVADSDYSILVSDFVLATKREVESAWDWTALRQVIQVTTVQGTSAYTLTGAGRRFKTQDVYNITDEQFLTPINAKLGRVDILDAQQDQPRQYFYEGIDTSTGDLKVKLTPVADGVHVINFNLVVPQTDAPADSDEILMDEWPIILGSWAKAIDERGEDSGKNVANAVQQYEVALSDSVAIDFARQPEEQDWYV